MGDEELQAIRAQRMAQLQNQYGVSIYVQLRNEVTEWISTRDVQSATGQLADKPPGGLDNSSKLGCGWNARNMLFFFVNYYFTKDFSTCMENLVNII